MTLPRIPVFIPAFNNPTYLRRLLRALSRFPGLDMIVLDNASSFPAMAELYDEIAAEVQVWRLGANLGPRALWQDRGFLASLPRRFCLTDPDLALNPALPADFIDVLTRVTETYQIGKAGFALDLSDRDRMVQHRFRHAGGWQHIWESEARHWAMPLCDPGFADPLYLCEIDTTFALYDTAHFDPAHPFEAIRVAGRFTCRHLPWYRDNDLPADEEAFYRQASEFSYFLADRPALQLRTLFARQDAGGP